MRIGERRGRPARGFTWFGLLALLALWGALLAVGAQQQVTAQRRERERELLFRGAQIARAIGDWRRAQPGAADPEHLADLLHDSRSQPPRAHLRRLWADPFTGRPDWVLQRDPATGRIVGLHSRSPLPRVLRDHGPEAAGSRVSDWVFRPAAPPDPGGGTPP